MSTEKITATTRTEFGKGAARRLRREGLIPAVVYGHGSEATHLALPSHDTTMALRHHGKNAVLELVVDGESQLALTKQIQIDDLRRVIEHIDFVAVVKGEKVTADVSITIVGDAAPGMLVTVENNTVAVETEPISIPESIEVSVEGAQAGTQITAADLVLPEGVTLAADPDLLVVHVSAAPSAEQVEAELVAAEAQAGIVHEESTESSASESE